MPGARWFPEATLNHAELSLRRHDDHPALLFGNEAGELGTIGYAELGRRVAAAAEGLRRLGVAKGDRVVAYLPNVPETVIAMLATASIGAVWSSCAPEFGVSSVVDRFAQIEPKVLVAVDGYRYNGAWHDRRDALAEIRRRLPTLEATVLVGSSGRDGSGAAGPDAGTTTWDRLLEDGAGAELAFEPVGFDHPLWVLYSSGTTGLPKAIVHGHGGIALELAKSISLHLDLGPADRFFWFTTTGWMMWNFLVGGCCSVRRWCCTTAAPATRTWGRCGASPSAPASPTSGPAPPSCWPA